MLVITNNPLAEQTLKERELCPVEYHDVPLKRLFEIVRDRIHQGYKLLTHPLSGSVKPNETPYKSIGISDKPEKSVDVDSLLLMEQAIDALSKFRVRHPNMSDSMRKDFQVVDLTLILSVF